MVKDGFRRLRIRLCEEGEGGCVGRGCISQWDKSRGQGRDHAIRI
jgi:hypothetical protein